MKKVLSMLLATALTISMLSISVSAFHVDLISFNTDPFTGEEKNHVLYVRQEDGSFEKLPVFDEQGNQHYIQVGKNEWEKLDTPLSPEEVARQKAEAQAAEEAARVKKKAEMEQTYHIQITEDYAQSTAVLSELERQIQYIPSPLWEKVTAQLAGMGKTLKIENMSKTLSQGSNYAGFYTPEKVQIDIALGSVAVVIPHEYGHLLFMTILPRLYSSATLQQEWNALTGGEGPAYVSNYAATSYQEDLAETFHALLTGSVEGYDGVKNMALEYPDCLALKKINYLRQLLCKVFSLEENVFPNLTPSYPSEWAKAEVEEYQRVLGGGSESVVPSQGSAHTTGYKVGATRIQFVYAISEDLVRNLWSTGFFGDMAYAEYQKQWSPSPEKVNGSYQIPFTDVDQSAVSYAAICAIHSLNLNGIVRGKSSTAFDPNGQITRQEAATAIYRLCKALGYEFPTDTKTFADSDQIASWAQEAVRAVSAAGIMNGVGGNRFDPNGIYTCEQSALSLLRTYKMLASSIAQ